MTVKECIKKSISFDPTSFIYPRLVTEATSEVTRKLDALKKIDANMMMGFALGAAAFTLSWILPFTTIAIAGFAYGAYHLGLRQNAYNDYAESLEALKQVCDWTLNMHNVQKATANMKCEPVKNMMALLVTLMNETQLRDVLNDKIEDQFVAQAKQNNGKEVQVQGLKLLDAEQAKNLNFKVYGYEQGGFLAVLQGIGYAIRSGFYGLKDAMIGKAPITQSSTTDEEKEEDNRSAKPY